MEFFLSYQGSLFTTGHVKQKFKYRRTFMTQLMELDQYLKDHKVPSHLGFAPEKMRSVGPFRFLPLITTSCENVVDIDITLLSLCEPCCAKGYPTGDIDNILKAILDGLRMAQNQNEIRNETPQAGENPFYCLMEDDQIIRNIQVKHERLLFPTSKKLTEKEIFALIKVRIAPKFNGWTY
jgi:hypothetical protein